MPKMGLHYSLLSQTVEIRDEDIFGRQEIWGRPKTVIKKTGDLRKAKKWFLNLPFWANFYHITGLSGRDDRWPFDRFTNLHVIFVHLIFGGHYFLGEFFSFVVEIYFLGKYRVSHKKLYLVLGNFFFFFVEIYVWGKYIFWERKEVLVGRKEYLERRLKANLEDLLSLL